MVFERSANKNIETLEDVAKKLNDENIMVPINQTKRFLFLNESCYNKVNKKGRYSYEKEKKFYSRI